MADFGSLKKRSKLGKPPSMEQAKNNIQLPESHEVAENIDGRSLRKTNRTHQLATRVKYEFYRKVKGMAFDEDITIAELLEKAIAKYEESNR